MAAEPPFGRRGGREILAGRGGPPRMAAILQPVPLAEPLPHRDLKRVDELAFDLHPGEQRAAQHLGHRLDPRLESIKSAGIVAGHAVPPTRTVAHVIP